MQERRNSSANALELRLSCTNPSKSWTDMYNIKTSVMGMPSGGCCWDCSPGDMIIVKSWQIIWRSGTSTWKLLVLSPQTVTLWCDCVISTSWVVPVLLTRVTCPIAMDHLKAVAILDIPPQICQKLKMWKMLFIHNFHFRCPIILKFCTKHSSIIAMLCAKIWND